MLNTKNVLMLVVLSAGLLIVLTGTAISQVQPAFANDEQECNRNVMTMVTTIALKKTK